MSIPNPVEFLNFESSYFTDQARSIYTKIVDGNAFANPLSSIIDSTTGTIDEVIDVLDGYASDLPTGFTLQDITDIKDATLDFLGIQETFLAHTNRLSGVDLSNSNAFATPNVLALFSAGRSAVALEHALDSTVGNPCGKMLGLFGSLFLGKELYDEIGSFYQTLINIIDTAEMTPQAILSQIEQFKNQIEMFIDGDRAFYTGIISDLTRAAIAQTLPGIFEFECGKYLISKVIGKTDLVDIF